MSEQAPGTVPAPGGDGRPPADAAGRDGGQGSGRGSRRGSGEIGGLGGGRLRPSEGGFALRVLTAWADLRASMASVLASRPPESRILMFAMTEGAIRFLADTAQLFATAARDGVAADDEAVTARIAASFTGSLIMRPLMLYLLAAVAGGIARRAGGTGSWRDSRAAVCWAALVAAPIFVATSTVQTAVVLPALAQEAVWMINVSSFAVALAYCLAEAHGFRRVWAVFLVIGVSTILLVAGALALSRL